MKKYIKTAIGLVVGFIFFLIICSVLNFIYVSYDPWNRILFHSYYEQEKIDNVFLGSSHVYCDINPTILDQLNKGNNFNLSTPAQRWDDTYYLLKDVTSRFAVKNVYLECYYFYLLESPVRNEEEKKTEMMDYIDNQENLSRPWQLSYAMRPSLAAFSILFGSADFDHIIETVFPFARYRENVFNREAILENIKSKTSDGYKNFAYHVENRDDDGNTHCIDYLEKGYYFSDRKLMDREKCVFQTSDLEKGAFGAKSEKYLRKTIEMCQSKGITIKLFVSPIFDTQLLSTIDYDRYIIMLKSISDEYGVELYDFNLVKNEYLNIKHGDYFFDMGHLNGEGASLFTRALWDVLQSSPEENKDRFYKTYRERLQDTEPELYGLYYWGSDTGEEINADGTTAYSMYHYEIADNRDMRYRISRTIVDKTGNGKDESVFVQDFDGNKEFDVPQGQEGIISIDAEYEGKVYSLQLKYF